MEPECKVRLTIFEGPLDLLLHLINKNKLDIKDIPISLVTNQYLEYLTFLKALNIEVAAEYLVMAATLMHIKSRMLLPREQKGDLCEEDDPRLEITKALKELKKAKEYAQLLNSQPILGRDVFVRPPVLDELKGKMDQDNESFPEVNLIDLIDAFKTVLKGKPFPKTIEIERAKIALDKRVDEISKMLSDKKSISFFALFDREIDKILIIVTFLAILELAKRGVVRLFQQQEDSDILILKREE